jgi:restriction endonuclease S subunit
MNKEIKLPKNWKWVRLAEVGKIISGGTPSTVISEYWNGNINWIAPSDLTGYKKIKIKSGKKSITEAGLKKSSAKLMPKGSVLFSSRAPIGYVAIADEELCTNQGFKSVIPNDFVDNFFLYYYLKASKQEAEKVASGTTFKEISLRSFSELKFPLPALETQQAIVSKIEELFSELDKGIEDLKTAQLQLKTYRQSVLKYAFEGKLTNEKVKEGILPKGWRLENLNNVSKIVSGFAFKSSDFISTGIPVIKISNVGYSEFVWKDQKYLSKDFLISNSDFILKGGDLLIALTRPITNNTTKICRFPQNIGEGLLNQRVACIKEYKINENFLFLFFQTNVFKEYIRSKFSETLQPNLSPKDLALTPIPVCSNEEQHRIVQEIESRLSVADKMEESIAQSLQHAEALRQSILKKAFSGELV